MGILRLLLFLLAGWLLWRLLQPYLGGGPARPSRRRDEAVEKMVRCRYCGINLPEREAIRDDIGYYCGVEHQRLAGKE